MEANYDFIKIKNEIRLSIYFTDGLNDRYYIYKAAPKRRLFYILPGEIWFLPKMKS